MRSIVSGCNKKAQSEESMSKKIFKAGIELIIGAVLVAGAILYYHHVLAKAVKPKRKNVSEPYVIVEKQKSAKFKDVIESLGTGTSKEAVDITSTVTAKVVQINFNDGDFVEKDTLLVKLDDDKEQAQKAQALININEQQREMQRIEKLAKSRAVSQKNYDEQKTSLARAKTELDIVEVEIADRHLRAPFKGRLGMRLVSLGDLVTPGTKITTIDDISILHVDFSIPEKYFAVLKKGREVEVTNAAYPGKVFKGILTAISPRINEQTRMVSARASIDNKENLLRPGMMFTVRVDMGEPELLMIPERSVTSLGEIQSVYLYDPKGFVKRTVVNLGRRKGGRVEVISGIRSGDVIVVEGVSKLTDGMKVKLEKVAQNKNGAKK